MEEQDAVGNCIMRNVIIIVFTGFYEGDEIKEGEMGSAYSTHGRGNKYIHFYR
jgi:hypothetical protein